MCTKEIIDNITKNYDVIFPTWREIEKKISQTLDSAGIFYRLFARRKSLSSIKKKMEDKAEIKYVPERLKMQDALGFRIVLYYADDVEVCINLLQSVFEVDNWERDQLDLATFKPCRTNYVFKLPKDSAIRLPSEISDLCFIDNTFEVQIRTIFSEGWHEVEHDIRYKFSSDWEDHAKLSRELNGLFAVLEVCDHDIISICEKFSYENYKNQKWEAMIRNKYRLRFQDRRMDSRIVEYFNKNNSVAKQVYRYNREKLIKILYDTKLPINYDNIIYIINFVDIRDSGILKITPKIVQRRVENSLRILQENV